MRTRIIAGNTFTRVVLIAVLQVAVCLAATPARSALFIVNDVSTADSYGSYGCTLARAIRYMNAGTAGSDILCVAGGTFGVDDAIYFNIGTGTPKITVTSNGFDYQQIPDINVPLVIQGASGGATRIEIVPGAGATLPALRVRSSNVEIRNLVIHGFPLAQIDVGSVSNVQIEGSYLGTNTSGLTSSPTSNGIVANGSSSVAIGGNVISGNKFAGMNITNASNIQISGNYIGVGADGLTALGNCGDGSDGSTGAIAISSSQFITIGGNVIAANHCNGIRAAGTGNPGSDPDNVIVTGNLIGVGVDGVTPRGNGGALANADCGVKILADSDVVYNAVNGNVIANNQYCGVLGEGGGIAGNVPTNVIGVEGNTLFGNGVLGFDLSATLSGDGATANDANGHDSGANLFQNHPALTNAWNTVGDQLYVTGTLSSPNTPNQTVRVEVFANSTGETQGRYFLGAFGIVLDGSGNAPFKDQGPFALPPVAPDITLTATTDYGSSEISVASTSATSTDILFANSLDLE